MTKQEQLFGQEDLFVFEEFDLLFSEELLSELSELEDFFVFEEFDLLFSKELL